MARSQQLHGRRSRSHRSGHGVLLILVLLGIAIGLYLMFGNMGGTSYVQQVKQTKESGTDMVRQISTSQMSMLIAMYRQQNNKLPSSVADLEAPAGSFNDPWGHEMTFTFDTMKTPTGITYHSNGPDGEAKTGDEKTYTDTVPY